MKHTKTSKTKFRRISPFGTTPFKKAHKGKTRWYCGPFRRSINTRFKQKSIKKKRKEKEWTEVTQNLKNII